MVVGDGSASSGRGIPPYFVASFCLAVKDKTGPPQFANHFIWAYAGKPTHQDIVMGMRTSPPAGAADRSTAGISSPCS